MISYFLPNQPHLEIRLLRSTDRIDLNNFCSKCKTFGWTNNESFESIKLNQMEMPYGQFFVGYDHIKNQIWTLAGVHKLPEIHNTAWRCLFRGAQLPGYKLSNGLSKDLLKTGVQINVILWMQINFIQRIEPTAEFFISSNNLQNEKFFASSQRLDQRIMPLMANRNIVDKVHENFMLYNTSQTIWKVNIETFFDQRESALLAISNTIS